MNREQADLPLLIFDGDCGFCRLWIERWKATTRNRVRYAPFQEVAQEFSQVPLQAFKRSVQLITPGGEVLAGAHAVFRTLAYAPGHGSMLWVYEHIPGAAVLSETGYRLVASHRHFFSKLVRLLWGKQLPCSSFVLTRWIFLRMLGHIYLIAFLSLVPQISGLVGGQGILPAARFLQAVSENVGAERYWLFPTLAWFSASDAFLRGLVLGGVLLSLLLIAGIATVPVLISLWVFNLSLVTAGQDFLMFQWDALLLETGLLAVFFAPWQLWPRPSREREPSRVILWLLRLLLFRLLFSSGVAKLASGDPTWRRLTALEFHYETQPLPTPVAWTMHQLPGGFQKASVVFMFLVELVIPFLIFAPRRIRFFAGGSFIAFQVLIAITGNYTYFSLLTIALCLPLFDDAALAWLLPRHFRDRLGQGHANGGRSRVKRVVKACLAAVIVLAGVAEIPGVSLERKLPAPGVQVLNWMRELRVINRYGLFSVMTTARPEIVIEGSQDGERWAAYEFKYKPDDVMRPPPWIAPYQPRLDWQMWFAALGSYRENPWFPNLMLRLLEGSPPVLALFGRNPFPDKPPRYVRALVYEYHFTDSAEKSATGAWWRRRLLGIYFPVVNLE